MLFDFPCNQISLHKLEESEDTKRQVPKTKDAIQKQTTTKEAKKDITSITKSDYDQSSVLTARRICKGNKSKCREVNRTIIPSASNYLHLKVKVWF